MKNPILFLRYAGLVEAVSFIVLVVFAMPLKYFAGFPIAVKLAGSVHGALFIVLCVALLQTMMVAKWPMSRGALVFLAALVPFGPFLIDRRMLGYDAEFRERQAARVMQSVDVEKR
jgi:integral membrane protein